MQQNAFKKISAPLVVKPVVDDKVWKRIHATEQKQNSSKILDQIVLQYLSTKSVDFQRCNEALTI